MVGLASYDASKHAVWGFLQNIALELAGLSSLGERGCARRHHDEGCRDDTDPGGKDVPVARDPEPPRWKSRWEEWECLMI